MGMAYRALMSQWTRSTPVQHDGKTGSASENTQGCVVIHDSIIKALFSPQRLLENAIHLTVCARNNLTDALHAVPDTSMSTGHLNASTAHRTHYYQKTSHLS